MSPNNGDKKFSQLPPRAQLEAVKNQQEGHVVCQITATAFGNGDCRINRPNCRTLPEHAGVIDLLATVIVAQAQEQQKA